MATKRDDSGAGASRSGWLGYVQIIVILAAIAVALYFAQAPERVRRDAADLGSERGKPVVEVVRPQPTAQALVVHLTGSVRTQARVAVMSEVVGRVAWIAPDFRNGGAVAANEPIVRLDPTEFEIRVAAAKARLEIAQAHLRMVGAGESKAEGSAGQERQQERARRVARIERAEAKLHAAGVALKLAELQLARTVVSLPYDIRVVNTDVEVGELVGPPEEVGETARLGVAYRTGAVEVDVPVEPNDLRYLEPVIGRAASIHTNSGSYEAEVVRVSSVIAPRTRLASLFLRFSGDLPPESLPLPGSFAEAVIAGPSYEEVYVLPEAVAQDRDTVWLVRDGALTRFEPTARGRVETGWVVDAFDAAEGVVVGTLPGAMDGLAVTVMDTAGSR